MYVLEVDQMTKNFGGVTANDEISFHIEAGEIIGLIGPNGAGKTTIFNTITGQHKPDSGRIHFNGRDITKLRPDKIAKRGIARTFQKLRPFKGLTVLENVMVGALCRTSNIREAKEIALELINFVGLSKKKNGFADKLSTGQRKRLEMARAMATKPKLLLLDEVTGGVDPQGVPQLVELMYQLREQGVTLCVIEHRIKVIMSISDRIIALHLGAKIAEGTPREIGNHPQVIESYLGEVYARS